MDQGQAVATGTSAAVIEEYAKRTKRKGSFTNVPDKRGNGLGLARGIITDAWLENSDGSRVTFVPMGAQASFCFQFSCTERVIKPSFGFGLEKLNGDRLFSMNNYFSGADIGSARCGKAVWIVPSLPLLPGTYQITVSVYENDRTCVDRIDGAVQFDVIPSNYFGTGRLPEPSQGVLAVRGDVLFIGE
jgi:lipopolysaccharide transport system ATP-binding protein